MNVTITDSTGTSGSVTVERGRVADTVAAWFPQPTDGITEKLAQLQRSLDTAPADQLGGHDIDGLCAWLRVTLEPVTE